jgi:copper homeostasis protein
MSESQMPLLEIAANSLASALAAQEGGADRIELCENLGEGGTTPSHGTVAMARERLHIPVYVLIRPRAGDFLYDALEIETMRRDIEHCARLGCDGVVIGALDAEGAVATSVCRELIAAAGTMRITFHRAFDAARDSVEALEAIIALGCERVLTSGARANAREGATAIAAHVAQAGSRLRVMAGAGITPDNIAEIARLTGVRELHASAKGTQASAMRFRNAALSGLDVDWMQTQSAHVRALKQALQSG